MKKRSAATQVDCTHACIWLMSLWYHTASVSLRLSWAALLISCTWLIYISFNINVYITYSGSWLVRAVKTIFKWQFASKWDGTEQVEVGCLPCLLFWADSQRIYLSLWETGFVDVSVFRGMMSLCLMSSLVYLSVLLQGLLLENKIDLLCNLFIFLKI